MFGLLMPASGVLATLDTLTAKCDELLCGFAAGEGEYVAFAEECSCDGPVESWLQNVVDAMRAALSHEFKVAIPAYDEKPRIKWIFDYSVQNTIMVSRTFFTQDVNEAFEELEEGNEDALKVSHSSIVCPNSAGNSMTVLAR